tara:strand:- start:11036 stop:13849 length:2814 start_codon:yes stop_codon:yes gene_type:complete
MSLELFLKKFITKDKESINYIKIGNNELNVFGNKYSIQQDYVSDFYDIYRKEVFSKKKEAYLVEKQLDIGKYLIDLDFRYGMNITSKQHKKEHIESFIETCINIFTDIYKCIKNNAIKFYIFEKEDVNCCDNLTKDGIHIIINILEDYGTKQIFRKKLIEQLPIIWDDLPLTNSWDNIVDDAVIKGNVGWQLYGSRKPGNEPYKLLYYYETNIQDYNTVQLNEIKIENLNFDILFPELCARDKTKCNQFKIKDEYITEHDSYLTSKLKVKKKNNDCNSICDISCETDLDSMIDNLFQDTSIEYRIKEIHQYTLALPKDFWGPGSYDKWIRVCWALKNTSEALLLTWIKFCSKSDDFDYAANNALDYWNDGESYNNSGLSFKSIIYWCKTHNPTEYKNIYQNTVDYYIYYSFKNTTDHDLANTLYHMFKSQYVCTSIKDNIWYEFNNNRWEPNDRGTSLRLKISTEMYKKYEEKLFIYQTSCNASQNGVLTNKNDKDNSLLDPLQNSILNNYKDTDNDEQKDYIKKRNEMSNTCKLLKDTSKKNHIMKESQEIFWDKDFYNKLDKNSYLIGCRNCIIDFKNKTHRRGKHDDYISKSTNLTYHTLDYYKKKSSEIIDEITTFMEQLFPNKELNQYMWEHLASTLIGTNENQTFNIYTGSGANGKSKLVELMSLVLGEYKGTVPISLITQKRSNIGGTSSELYNLIGTRYAVMQEPSKGDKINEGIMKELTGGDPIQCRALFQNSINFIPQFKLIVCTNTLFDIVSNDDGTWRRLRKVDFESKFTETPYEDSRFPKKEYKYQFKIDTKLDEKFKTWAPVLLSMLVDIAYRTQGKVKDVNAVIASTQKYRQEQDVFLEFYNTYYISDPNSKNVIGIRTITNKFSEWFGQQGYKTKMVQPRAPEVTKYFDKIHEKIKGHDGGWIGIREKTEIYSSELSEFTS